jgi:MFS family permease
MAFATCAAAGVTTVLCPRYIAEISPPAIRGALSTATQLSTNVGIMAAFALGLPYDHGITGVSVAGARVRWWQLIFLISGVLPALQVRPDCHSHIRAT